MFPPRERFSCCPRLNVIHRSFSLTSVFVSEQKAQSQTECVFCESSPLLVIMHHELWWMRASRLCSWNTAKWRAEAAAAGRLWESSPAEVWNSGTRVRGSLRFIQHESQPRQHEGQWDFYQITWEGCICTDCKNHKVSRGREGGGITKYTKYTKDKPQGREVSQKKKKEKGGLSSGGMSGPRLTRNTHSRALNQNHRLHQHITRCGQHVY